MGLKVTNNAFGTLNAGINSTDTVIVLEAGQGARFPVLSAGDYFYATLIDTSNQLEIVKVTARATDTMTVVRAQDGTSSRAYNVNDRFELRPTAALFNEKANDDDVTASLATKQAASPVLTTYVDTGVGTRNRIINGDMRINQRGATSGVTVGYFVDRWQVGGASGSSVVTSSLPSGFSRALSIDRNVVGTAFTFQRIESANCQDLAGQSVTVSFLAKGSGVSTVPVVLKHANTADNFAAMTVIAIVNATASLAADWTKYFVTFSNLPSGSINGVELEINATIASSGSMQITGCQLEAGAVATPFERRPFGAELALCQRYFETNTRGLAGGAGNDSTRVFAFSGNDFKATKRATPTVTVRSAQSNTAGQISGYSSGSERVVNDIAAPTVDRLCAYLQVTASISSFEPQTYSWQASSEL